MKPARAVWLDAGLNHSKRYIIVMVSITNVIREVETY